jgi:hypothetical protein
MNYPVFIYHELVMRLAAVDRAVGSYLEHRFELNTCVIATRKGSFSVNAQLLEKQYNDPTLISEREIEALLSNFQWASASQQFA